MRNGHRNTRKHTELRTKESPLTTQTISHRYDSVGRVDFVDDLTFTFGRNAASQLTSLTSSDASFLSQPATAVTDTYTANQLNQIGTLNAVSLSHDANGNLTSDGTYTFEYDEENRLRSAVGGGFTTTYEYDPLGRRRAKIVNGTPTRFVSDAAEEIEERDGSNNVLRKYAYGSSIDDRIAMKDAAACTGANTWCFYLTNWQGSTTTLVNQNGTLKDVYHYGPYGEGVGWTPADAFTGNPFRYTGRRIDPETGLYYYRARYYSTKIGRFLQTDPVGTKDDLNLYAYDANDPLNKTDPFGLAGCGDSISNQTECDNAMAAQRTALERVGATRQALRQLKEERAAVASGKQEKLSDAASATAAKLAKYFKSSSDKTINRVDRVLAGVEKVLEDDGSNFNFQDVSSNKMASARTGPSSIAVAHPILGRNMFLTPRFHNGTLTTAEERIDTVIHEAAHLKGINVMPPNPEAYGSDIFKLGAYRSRNNADNYSQFVTQ